MSKVINGIDKLNEKAWIENRKDPELAISISKKALIESKKNKYVKGKAVAIHTMGAAYGWLSEFDKASEYLEQALSLFSSEEDLDGVADTTYSIGVIDYLSGNFKKAKTNFHKSLDIYLSTENLTGETNAYNGLGSAYTEIGAYDDAWDYLNRGLKISESSEETIIRPKILDGLATLCNIKGDHEKAILFFEKSRKLNKNLNNQNQESYNLHGIGESYMRMKKYDKAKSHFEESISIRRSLGFKVGEAQSEQSLGSVYYKLKDYESAEKHLVYALDLAKKINGKNIEMLASESLAKLYEKKKEYEKFAEHLKNYYELKSKLFSEEKEKQQHYDLEKANLNTKVLSEIGQEIISSLELEKVLFTIYEKVNKLMDAGVFGLGLYIPKEEIIEYKLVIDRGKKLEPYTRDMKDKSQLAVWTIENKRAIFINDVEKDKSKYGEAFSSEKEIELHKKHQTKISNVEQSYIYIPIMNGENVIGVITVQSFDKNAYTQDHLDILKNIAVYASIGVINSRMYQALEEKIALSEKFDEQHKELEQAYENTRILNEIGQRIAMSISINEVIEKVYDSINTLMDATVFSIGIYKKERKALEFKGSMEKGKKLKTISLDLNDKNRPAIYCFTNKKEIVSNDWIKDRKKYIKKHVAPIVGEQVESLMYFPLLSKGTVLGVISVQSFKKNSYSKRQTDILRSLTVYASSALENALLYESMEEQVKERTHEIEQSYQNTKVLGEIGMDIISTLELDKVLFTIYEKTNKLMDATIFGIGILSADRESIEYRLAIDRGTKYEPYSRNAKDKTQFAVWCIDNKKPVFINDVEKEKYNYLKKHKTDEELGIMTPTDEVEQSLMYVPLLSAEEVIGVISVQSYKKNSYTQQDLNILQNLSIFLSTALVNATLYESMEEKVRLRTEELVSQKEKAEKLMEKAEFEREEAKYQRRRAEQSERFKQQFLANMSHEIRTPMNAIMGMTNLILDKDPKKEQVSYLNTIRLSSESLLVIINDILDLSKIEAGKMELEQVNFNLEEVVNLIEKTLSYRADEKGLVLSVSYDDQIPDVLVGDAVRLQQVLTNIAGNALKFTEKGGVSISVNLEGGILHGDHAKVRFEIRDTGIGMTRDQQNRVFENFSQASSDTTRKYGGTGLGLSISSKLIDLFGSSIKLESEMGKGSTFHFVINFKISEDQKLVRKDLTISDDMMKELDGIRILIAEDNEYNRIVVTETLELKIPNIKLQCAINGEEAVKMAEANASDIDVVLMDVQMPVMDGFSATRTIRGSKNKTLNTLPIIALTASVIKADIQKCYDAGMNGYIPKPFKTSELIQSIYQAVKKGVKNDDFKKYNLEPELHEKLDKVTHLSFLQEFTEGDRSRMKKYVEMYLDSALSNVPKLKDHLKKKQVEKLRTLVHSMKPHFDFMGMGYARELAEKIEELLIHDPKDSAISSSLDKLIEIINQSISELKESLLTMEGVKLR